MPPPATSPVPHDFPHSALPVARRKDVCVLGEEQFELQQEPRAPSPTHPQDDHLEGFLEVPAKKQAEKDHIKVHYFCSCLNLSPGLVAAFKNSTKGPLSLKDF